ncbi:uncharacterized protein LOC129753118 [Uranotaenia lowii]|uniref:uncharacterized protein LOC129753118 n=1 Tax=Uranotaenia lowii TaxID=190385 RepID=UPI00247A8A63|nr:uncharacterized protein LOC129753118 [Uranotaenia lowii]
MEPRTLFSATDSVALLLNQLALGVLSKYYCTCIVRTSDDAVVISEILPAMVITVDDRFDESFQQGVDNGCQSFITFETSIWMFLDHFIDVHDASDQRFSDKVLIVLAEYVNDSFIQRISEHPSVKDLRNTLIVASDSEEKLLKLLTVDIFGNGSPGTTIVQFSAISLEQFLPDDGQNFRGIPVRLQSVVNPPFGYYEKTTPDKANARCDPQYCSEDVPLYIDGSEPMLLVHFCQRYNCSIEAYFDEIELWGDVYPNRSGPGVLGAIANRKTDFAVAALYFWIQPYVFSTYTESISRSGVTILVPKPRLVDPWRTPFLSFSPHLWIAVALAFLAGVLSVWFLERVRVQIIEHGEPKSISDSVLTIIGFYMEQTAIMRNDLVSCVFLFSSLMLAGFMVGNLYGAGLASIMTIPQYEKPIDTGRDFAESNMLLAGSAISWIYAIMEAPQPFLQKIVENYRLVDIDYMIDHRYALDIGYIGERTQFGHFGPIDFLDEGSASLMRLLKDDLFWQMCTAIVSKTWPLKHHFNKLVLAVKESGIQNYWELQIVKNYMNSKIQQGILDSRNTNQGSEAETLTTSHLMGSYMILGSLPLPLESSATERLRRWLSMLVWWPSSLLTIIVAHWSTVATELLQIDI